jgi:hypothetical protein
VPSTTAMRHYAAGLSAQTPHGLPPILWDGFCTCSLPPCDPTSTHIPRRVPLLGACKHARRHGSSGTRARRPAGRLYPPPKVPIDRRAKYPNCKGRDWQVHEVPVPGKPQMIRSTEVVGCPARSSRAATTRHHFRRRACVRVSPPGCREPFGLLPTTQWSPGDCPTLRPAGAAHQAAAALARSTAAATSSAPAIGTRATSSPVAGVGGDQQTVLDDGQTRSVRCGHDPLP